MAEILTMGELIVEIMRPKEDMPLDMAGTFLGPFPSGAPAIFIDTAARLGHSAAIIGGVGDDDFGRCLVNRLKKDGVDCSNVLISSKGSTGCAFVNYFHDGSRKFIFHMDNTPAVIAKPLDEKSLVGTKYFHIMGCSLMANLQFGQNILKTMHNAKSIGAKVSFDPNIRSELIKDDSCLSIIQEVLSNASIFLPGVSELMMVTGQSSLQDAIKTCFEYPNLEILVIKNGSKGCIVYTRKENFQMGVFPITPVDATGAGDSFDATFLCSLLEGKTIKDCAIRASAAAALNTLAFGPMEGNISPNTIENLIKESEI